MGATVYLQEPPGAGEAELGGDAAREEDRT